MGKARFVLTGIKRLFDSRPVHAQLVVTYECNLACAYCHEYANGAPIVPFDVLARRIDALGELGAFTFDLLGGEPLLHPDIVRLVVERAEQGDVVIPRVGHQLETMHAAYAKPCLPYIEKRLLAGQLKIVDFFDRVRVVEVAEADVARFRDPRLAFMNVNTPEELAQAEVLAARLG